MFGKVLILIDNLLEMLFLRARFFVYSFFSFFSIWKMRLAAWDSLGLGLGRLRAGHVSVELMSSFIRAAMNKQDRMREKDGTVNGPTGGLSGRLTGGLIWEFSVTELRKKQTLTCYWTIAAVRSCTYTTKVSSKAKWGWIHGRTDWLCDIKDFRYDMIFYDM